MADQIDYSKHIRREATIADQAAEEFIMKE
jgi:hypothetical protein